MRQSARKMRLVIDLIRGARRAGGVRDPAVLQEARGEADPQGAEVGGGQREQAAQRSNEPFDVDRLRVRYAIVNEGRR